MRVGAAGLLEQCLLVEDSHRRYLQQAGGDGAEARREAEAAHAVVVEAQAQGLQERAMRGSLHVVGSEAAHRGLPDRRAVGGDLVPAQHRAQNDEPVAPELLHLEIRDCVVGFQRRQLGVRGQWGGGIGAHHALLVPTIARRFRRHRTELPAPLHTHVGIVTVPIHNSLWGQYRCRDFNSR